MRKTNKPPLSPQNMCHDDDETETNFEKIRIDAMVPQYPDREQIFSDHANI